MQSIKHNKEIDLSTMKLENYLNHLMRLTKSSDNIRDLNLRYYISKHKLDFGLSAGFCLGALKEFNESNLTNINVNILELQDRLKIMLSTIGRNLTDDFKQLSEYNSEYRKQWILKFPLRSILYATGIGAIISAYLDKNKPKTIYDYDAYDYNVGYFVGNTQNNLIGYMYHKISSTVEKLWDPSETKLKISFGIWTLCAWVFLAAALIFSWSSVVLGIAIFCVFSGVFSMTMAASRYKEYKKFMHNKFKDTLCSSSDGRDFIKYLDETSIEIKSLQGLLETERNKLAKDKANSVVYSFLERTSELLEDQSKQCDDKANNNPKIKDIKKIGLKSDLQKFDAPR